MPFSHRQEGKGKAYFLAFLALLLTISLIRYPQVAFESSLSGLRIWWDIVFPALLPFFIFSQILIGLGVVHFLGVLLEPVMRPVFNVPGAGSFVMAMGLASGFPIGAVLTTKLRQQGLCNKIEGERLISFVNTADPLFMFGAVAVGMLHTPEAGLIIAAAHYLSTITVGLLMRFYKSRDQKNKQAGRLDRLGKEPGSRLNRALYALVQARKQDARPLGQLLGDAVRDSMNTLILIGGFIMLFSVIIAVTEVVGLAGIISSFFAFSLGKAGMAKELAPALFSGLLEVDLGCQAVSVELPVPLEQRLAALSAIIAWSGLSVHAQVASIISSTDLSIIPYIVARFLHAVLACIYSLLLFGPLHPLVSLEQEALPVFLQTVPRGNISYLYERTAFVSWRILVILFVLLITAAGIELIKKKATKALRQA